MGGGTGTGADTFLSVANDAPQVVIAADLSDRRIELRQVVNMRDLGGLPVAGGGRTRFGWFYRTDSWTHSSAGDAEKVEGLGIGTYIDMRTDSNHRRYGVGALANSRVDVLNLQLVDDKHDIKAGDPRSGWLRMDEVYARLIDDCRPYVREIIETLAESDRPVMFGCEAGKDRTGVLTAMIYELCGVSDADICADYAATWPAMKVLRARGAAIARDSHGVFGEWAVKSCFGNEGWSAYPERMQSFLNTMRRNYQSAHHYFLSCGISPQTLGRLRTKLVDTY